MDTSKRMANSRLRRSISAHIQDMRERGLSEEYIDDCERLLLKLLEHFWDRGVRASLPPWASHTTAALAGSLF